MRRKPLMSMDEGKDFLFNLSLEDSLSPLMEDSAGKTRIRSLQNSPLVKAALQTAMLKDLTERQRECVDLYYLQGLTLEETGQQLGIGKATVFRHLQRAKKHLERAVNRAVAMQSLLNDEAD